MAKKKENLRDLAPDALNKQLVLLEENLRSLRFNTQNGKVKNVKEQASLKKQVARILTILNTK